MGYNTEFRGGFNLNKPLSPEHKEYLIRFSESKRFGKRAERFKDTAREAVGLPYGDEGCYSVIEAETPINYNAPAKGQPGMWCQWVPNLDGTKIVWDGGEKFYNYVQWLQYIIKHFLKPWGYVLNGKCDWRGDDDFYDIGTIFVDDNIIETFSWWGKRECYTIKTWEVEK